MTEADWKKLAEDEIVNIQERFLARTGKRILAVHVGDDEEIQCHIEVDPTAYTCNGITTAERACTLPFGHDGSCRS